MHLRRFRDDAPSVAGLCPWAFVVGSGVVQTAAGQLLVGYFGSPPDAASSTNGERAQTSSEVNRGLLCFGQGWASWNDVAVVPAASYPPAEASSFPHALPRLVDEERRRQFLAEGAHFENDRAIVLCYTPPAAVASRITQMMYRGGDQGEVRSAQAVALETVERTLSQFEDHVGSLLRLRRMQSYQTTDVAGREHRRDELVNYLHYCLTGQAMELTIPSYGMRLDGVIGGVDFWPGHTPIVGDEYVAVVVIEGFPAESVPGILDGLTVLEMPYRFTQRFVPHDEDVARKRLDDKRKFWAQRKTPFFRTILGMEGGAVNEDAARMEQACVVSMALSESGQVRHGFYNATVVLRSRDRHELTEMAREAARAIRRGGFAARLETENAPDAFLATLPGNIGNNVKKPLIHSGNVADLLPTSGIWTGHAFNPNPLYPQPAPPLLHARTQGGAPFRLNVSVGDVSHFGIFGPIGTGKSTLLNTIALQALRYQGMRVRGIDYKRSSFVPCVASGGRYHEVGGAGGPVLEPFRHLETVEDRAAAQAWAELCVQLQQGREADWSERDDIHQAIERLRGETARSVTNFLVFAQNAVVRGAMQAYALEGSAGWLFDADALTEDGSSHWEVFDITAILNAGDPVLLPAMAVIYRSFEREMAGAQEATKRPMIVTMDEAWVHLGHPAMKPRFHRWLVTARSFNCGLGFATQSLSAAVQSGLLDVIAENVPTLLFGPNAAAHTTGTPQHPGPSDFYKAFGFNTRQIDLVATASPKRNWYVTQQSEGARLIDLGLGPAALAFAAATSRDDVDDAKALIAADPEGWAWEWLRRKGVDHASLAAG